MMKKALQNCKAFFYIYKKIKLLMSFAVSQKPPDVANQVDSSKCEICVTVKLQ